MICVKIYAQPFLKSYFFFYLQVKAPKSASFDGGYRFIRPCQYFVSLS